jgi:microcystin-dependent protein
MGVAQLGVYWPYKALLQGSGISLVEDATTIRITNTGGTGGGTGDMLQSQFATNGTPGVVDHAVLADTATKADSATTAANVPWTGVTGAPTSFPTDWSLITSKPTVFPPATHGPTHRGKGADPIGIADTTDSGLLALLSGAATDFVGGDNQCHSLPATILNYGALPPGSMVGYAGATLPGAAGTWLWCQGQLVSRTTYAALFAAIGTLYGVGDGSTTFALPDMRSRSPVGAGQGAGTDQGGRPLTNRALASKNGEEFHLIAVSEMPSHAHGATVNDPGHSHTVPYVQNAASSNTASAVGEPGNRTVPSGYSATGISVAIAANGGGAIHNNMQPFLALNYIIKT